MGTQMQLVRNWNHKCGQQPAQAAQHKHIAFDLISVWVYDLIPSSATVISNFVLSAWCGPGCLPCTTFQWITLRVLLPASTLQLLWVGAGFERMGVPANT